MSMQVEDKCRLVLSLLTAIVLLGAMAATGAIYLRVRSSDVESGIILALSVLLLVLFPLSPYVFLFLFLCRSRMVTAAQASGLLCGSVAISGFGVLMLWCNVVQNLDSLSGLWFIITPVPQWIACVLLVAGIRYCLRSACCDQDTATEVADAGNGSRLG